MPTTVSVPSDVQVGVEVRAYDPTMKADWDEFVAGSKNGSFMFRRGFMDYHADRFVDSSLLFYEDSKLVAVLPANRTGNELGSHDGLTFGGLVSGPKMSAVHMLSVMGALVKWGREQGLVKLRYKATPLFLHTLPAGEDLYALTRFGARLVRRDLTTVLVPGKDAHLSTSRRWRVNRALKSGVEVKRTDRYEEFWPILTEVLGSRHGATPTHSLEEIRLLNSRFPEHIELFGAYLEGRMLAGAVMFVNPNVAHTQYLATTDEGRRVNALDALIATLITDLYAHAPWFSFGISTEREGTVLNEGLSDYKESFGGRSTVHDFYELDF